MTARFAVADPPAYLRQDMTVVELWPGGGGWFTEVLAPVLRERGKLITTNFDTSGPADAYGTLPGLART